MSDDYANDFALDGKVAVVTGGSRGLGRAIAWRLAMAGADVVVASRNEDACRACAREITERTGRRAWGTALHVGHWDEAEPFIDAAWSRYGRIDVLVNNAGMSPVYDSLPGVTEALFDKVLDVNLKGPFRLSSLAGARMQAAGGGSIVNITSMTAVRPRPHVVPYAAAKAGLNAMTVAMAHAFGPQVRCNAVMAGTFMTDIGAAWDPAAFAARAQGFALRRGGRPHEITGAVLYLASDAASYTTGSVLQVDGGQP